MSGGLYSLQMTSGIMQIFWFVGFLCVCAGSYLQRPAAENCWSSV